jgi:SET domain-containing protein
MIYYSLRGEGGGVEMLVVATKIAPSALDGYGLYAAQKIERGELVWRYDPSVDLTITLDELTLLPSRIRDVIVKRGSCEGGFYLLLGDGAAFINHSREANTHSIADEANCDTVASRDIEIGEEITEDYRESQSSQALKQHFW